MCRLRTPSEQYAFATSVLVSKYTVKCVLFKELRYEELMLAKVTQFETNDQWMVFEKHDRPTVHKVFFN
jgi:hypothetical protein